MSAPTPVAQLLETAVMNLVQYRGWWLLADAAHRAGAARIMAVVPYLAYARQDRRTAVGVPVGLRVVADRLHASHVDRLVVVDAPTPALESIVSVPVETITAVPVLADALRQHVDVGAVLVAPDLGAAKLVDRYGALPGLDVAMARKTPCLGRRGHRRRRGR